MADSPSFTDGRRGLKDPTLLNLNSLLNGSPRRLHYIDDNLVEAARTIDHELEGEGDHLGSDTKATGCLKGTINAQLDRADLAPNHRAGHVLSLLKGSLLQFFVVTSMPTPMKRNDVVRIAPAVTQVVNPFFKGLLSEDEGDTKRTSFSIATMGTTETIDPQPVNHRTGATKSYAATLSDGSVLPIGVAISASTGIITLTKASVVAGVYTISVTGLDVLANRRDLDCEATLILTITA